MSENRQGIHRGAGAGALCCALLSAFCVLLFGCAHPQSTVQSPESTARSRAAFSILDPQSSQSDQSVIVNPPSSSLIRWSWTFPPNHLLAYWEVSTNLLNWEFGGWTTNNFVLIAPTNHHQFFTFYSLPKSTSLRIGYGKPQPPDFF